MKKYFFHKKALLGTSLLTASISAAAQDTTPRLEEMIITGSRVLERIDEVPASVTIVNQDAIAKQMQSNVELNNLLAIKVPGMGPATGKTSNAGQMLRGRAPLILIDGVPQSTPLRNGSLGIRTLDAGAIERIEVIKGATSIYGNGAAGGVINYITKNADTSSAINGSAAFSTNFSVDHSDDTLGTRFQGGVNGGVENFSYLVDVSVDEYGVQRDADGDALGMIYGLSDTKTENFLTKLGYQINDNNALKLTYNYYEGRQDTDYSNVLHSNTEGLKSYAIDSGEGLKGIPPGPRGNQNLMLKYTSENWFGNTDFNLDGYWQEIDNVFFFSSWFVDSKLGYEGGQSRIYSDKKGIRANFNTQLDLGGVETSFTYGVDYLNDLTAQDLVDGRSWVPEMDMTNIAPYLQAKFIFSDHWVLKAGVRQEDIHIEIEDYQTLSRCPQPNVCSTSIPVSGGDLDYDATTYNIGFRYNGIDTFSPFISYSEGFDVSDLGRLLRSSTVTKLDLIHTEASIVENREIGFSGTFDKFNYEFAYYESESELGTNIILSPVTGLYEALRAPQEIWGYEAALGYDATDNLTLGATYSWTEGKNTEQDIYLNGNVIAPSKITAYLDWQATESLDISLDWMLVGKRDRFDTGANDIYGYHEAPVDDYDIVNLSANYQFDKVSIFVGIDNLFNEDYYPAISQSTVSSGYNVKGRGRWVTTGINYNF